MWPPSPALLNTNTSYPEPIAIPSSQPGDSPTMCVPINAQWIPIVAGALQQLAQANIWSGMTEAEALAAVGAAWDLIAAVANASACTVFELRFEMSCTLQYSTDGGSTWTDVPGWDSYFAACVGGSTGGGGGAPPPDITIDGPTLACNMAGYLVQTLLRQVITQVVDKIVASGVIEDVIGTIVALIPGIDAATPLVIAATDGLFTWIGDNLSYFTADVLTNLVWSKIGCIIYRALDPFVGWTATNLSGLIAAITGATVAPSQVLTAIANYLGGLGVPALQSITAPAYLTMYNCSSCMAAGDPIDLTSAPTLAQIPNLTVTDGTNTVTPTGTLTVVGGVVSGTSPNATLTITEPPTPAPSDAGSVLVTISAGQAVGTTAVVFTTTFASAPDVIAGSASGQVIASASDVTTSGFTLSLTARFAVTADTTILASWSAGAAPGGGGGGGGASLTVSDGTTTVTGVLEIDVVGASVADEGGGAAQIIVPASVPTFLQIADITTFTIGDFKCSFIASDLLPIYSSLVGIGRVQCDDDNGDDPYQPYVLVLNGDTGANYDWYMAELGTEGDWDTPVQTSATGDTSINLGTLPVPIREPYSGTTQLTITIPWYADPTAEKEVHVLVVSPDQKVWRIYGIWHNINPITQIAVQMNAGYHFVDGNSLVINGYY